MLRPVRSAAPLGRRLPLVAAAVVAAGLATACGPSSQPAGSAASAPGRSAQTLTPEAASATGATDASPTASASPSVSPSTSPSTSASASAGTRPAASPTPSRAQTGSAAGRKPGASTAPAPGRIPGPGYDSSADAQKQIDAALRAAKADGRTVLLDFGANWCGNCKAADKVFAQPQTAAILGASYHLVKIDIGGDSTANSALLRKYSPSGGTYTMPVLVVVSPSGTVRTDTHVTGNPSLTADGINAFLRKWAS
ncbi:thioredoxin family protein [Streptomyces sp. NPDC090022]|uniref:thioredoxin family protein n=1 Tax=Streptomyces sp. NPDC090022 TaxID=3365920 RepID=UPI0038190A98